MEFTPALIEFNVEARFLTFESEYHLTLNLSSKTQREKS
jgi:hypothetical protein